jgi:hypothetical protein
LEPLRGNIERRGVRHVLYPNGQEFRADYNSRYPVGLLLEELVVVHPEFHPEF